MKISIASFSRLLNQIHTLLELGLDELSTLQTIQKIHPKYNPLLSTIIERLKEGKPFHYCLESVIVKKPPIYFDIQAIDIKQWISFKIDALTHQSNCYSEIKSQLLGPCLLLVTSSILSWLFIMFYIPQINSMLHSFNILPPQWITLLLTIHSLFTTYFFYLIAILGCLLPLFNRVVSKVHTTLLRPIELFFLQKNLCQTMASLTNLGIDLKQLALSITCKETSIISQNITKFKQHILQEHNPELAFVAIINKNHLPIITHALATNQLSKGLSHIARLYSEQEKSYLSKATTATKFILLLFTGIQISAGFYLSLLPMSQLIKGMEQ